MARFPRQAVAAAALLAALLTGGCSTTVVGSPAADPAPAPTAGPGSDPVAWGDRLCGSLLAYYQPLSERPNYDGAGLDQIKQRLSDYLGKVGGGITAGQDQLRTVGASPVSGGDEFARAIGDLLTRTGETIAAAKADVDSANPQDIPGFQGKLKAAQDKLGTIGSVQGLDKLGATPRLDKAVATAPKCVQLNQLTGPPPPPAPENQPR